MLVPLTCVMAYAILCTDMATAANPRFFQMPAHSWQMVRRIVRAYGAAQNDDSSNVESVAKLAGIHRPIVSANNNFLRSVGILDLDKSKLTALGVKLATGIGVDNTSLVTEALEEIVLTTPILVQLINTLRARGAMDISAFRGQIILAVGLNEKSANLPMVKTLIDMMEESALIQVRDEKAFLREVADNNSIQPSVIFSPPRNEPVSIVDGGHRANTVDWAEMLLSKFPQFDPAWSDDVKLKWFDAFDRLMKGRGM
jgi:hypothetical protein